jgi:hypothetical protein
VLKAAAVLMFGAAGLLFFISDFSGMNTLTVILISTFMFWLPELFALVLVGLAFLHGKRPKQQSLCFYSDRPFVIHPIILFFLA